MAAGVSKLVCGEIGRCAMNVCNCVGATLTACRYGGSGSVCVECECVAGSSLYPSSRGWTVDVNINYDSTVSQMRAAHMFSHIPTGV